MNPKLVPGLKSELIGILILTSYSYLVLRKKSLIVQILLIIYRDYKRQIKHFLFFLKFFVMLELIIGLIAIFIAYLV